MIKTTTLESTTLTILRQLPITDRIHIKNQSRALLQMRQIQGLEIRKVEQH